MQARLQLLGCYVHTDDLIGGFEKRQRHDLFNGKADQRFSRRRDSFQVSDVECPDDIDAFVAQRESILPPLGVR